MTFDEIEAKPDFQAATKALVDALLALRTVARSYGLPLTHAALWQIVNAGIDAAEAAARAQGHASPPGRVVPFGRGRR